MKKLYVTGILLISLVLLSSYSYMDFREDYNKGFIITDSQPKVIEEDCNVFCFVRDKLNEVCDGLYLSRL